MESLPKLTEGYERVFTMTVYHDLPRQGVANYGGKPHFYDCVFLQGSDRYSGLYNLTPISEQIFELAMEDWAIWKRWESAFYSSRAARETHPALDEDRERHSQITKVLHEELRTDKRSCVVRRPEFAVFHEVELEVGAVRPLQVRWADPNKD